MNRSDDFNRADSATTLGTPSDGGSAWVSLQGTWGIASNQAYSPSAGSYDIAVLESGVADVTVAVTVPTVDQYPGVALRATDVNNLWAIYCVPGGINLYKRVAGTWSAALGTYAAGAQSGDRLQMVAQGNSIAVLLTRAGTTTTIIPAVTDSFNSTATQHGITTIISSADRFDDFSAAAIVPATSYTFTGPASGAAGVASTNFSVTPNGSYTGTVSVAVSGGGLSTTVTLNFTNSLPQTFTITPPSAGTVTLTPTASPALGANPAALTYASQQIYTTNGAGTDWATAANWTPTGVPAAGSTAVVNHPMTVASGTAAVVGTSTVGQTCLNLNAALTVADGGSLEVRGNVIEGSGGSFTGQGTGKVLFNSTLASPASTGWSWQVGTTPFTAHGTSNSARFRVESVAGGGNGAFTIANGSLGTGGIDLAYCDVIRVGDGTRHLCVPNFYNYAAAVSLDHCTLYQCGSVSAQLANATGGKFSLTYVSSVGSVGAWEQYGSSTLWAAGLSPTAPGTYQVTNCDFDTFTNLATGAPWVITGNVYRAGGADVPTAAAIPASSGPFGPTSLALSGPAGGIPGAASSAFTATLGGGTSGTVNVTPVVTGLTGTFSPSSLALSVASPTGTFTFTPSGSGSGTVSLTNDGTESPGNGPVLFLEPVTYSSSSTATLYTMTAPAHNYGVATWPSDAFTLALPAGQPVASPLVITLSDSGAGGTFTDSSGTPLSGNQVTLPASTPGASATFLYTPPASGLKSISATNGGGLTDPSPINYYAQRSYAEALPLWEQTRNGTAPGMSSAVGAHRYATTYGFPAGRGQLDAEDHYDPLSVYWRLQFAYPAEDYSDCIAAARYQMSDLWRTYCGGGLSQNWNPYSYGSRYDWEQTGNPDSLALTLLAFSPGPDAYYDFYYDYTTDWWESRPMAFATEAGMNAIRLGMAPNTSVRQSPLWINSALNYGDIINEGISFQFSYIDGWVSDPAMTNVGTTLPVACVAVQCFMCGLSLHTLIDFWDHYRAAPYGTSGYPAYQQYAAQVAAVPAYVKKMLDYLAGPAFQPDGICWPYWDRDTGPLSVKSPCNTTVSGYDGSRYSTPELNPSIGFAFAWYAWYLKAVQGRPYSEYAPYLRKFEESTAGSMAAWSDGTLGGTSTGTGYSIGYPKQFNQGFGTGELHGRVWRDMVVNPGNYAPPTAYALDLPDGDTGRANQLSARVRVQLTPPAGKSLGGTAAYAVTPSDGGAGGIFLPAFVALTPHEPVACFRYAPPASAANTTVTLSVTNDGGLTNPAPVTYHVTSVAPFATGLTLTYCGLPPHGPNEYSPDFTVALDPPGSVPPRSFDIWGGQVVPALACSVTAGSGSPFINPQNHSWVSGDHPSRTFQVRPGGATGLGIRVTSTPVTGWTTDLVTYTPAASDTGAAYTVNLAAGTGSPGSPVSGTVSLTGDLFGGTNITLSDGSGGTFSPNPVPLHTGRRAAAVTYTPATAGSKSLTATNASGLTAPAPVLFTATAPGGGAGAGGAQPPGGVRYAAVQTSTSGDTVLVTGVPGLRVVVYNIYLASAGAVSLTFKASSGTALTGAVPIASANLQPAWVDKSTGGLFYTAPGEGLTLNLGAAVAVGGYVGYALV